MTAAVDGAAAAGDIGSAGLESSKVISTCCESAVVSAAAYTGAVCDTRSASAATAGVGSSTAGITVFGTSVGNATAAVISAFRGGSYTAVGASLAAGVVAEALSSGWDTACRSLPRPQHFENSPADAGATVSNKNDKRKQQQQALVLRCQPA